MRIQAKSPEEYLAAIPAERRPHVERLRKLVKKAVPACEEGMQWGMISYSYQGRPFAAVASQKSYLSLHLMDLYTQPGLREKHQKALAPLKMGKGCLNFDSVDELPLDTISAILAAAPEGVVPSGTMAANQTQKKTATATKKTKTATANRKKQPRKRSQ